ncbi:hypothetical protein ARMGADRAFT_1059577 [Armillaria gallica]|uniref:Uncharacterized protein n=1 Tax=Armillaria gallica TaxID=47427 RepID=A0A2H3DW25_ARMGA|nr:hypothetical protein ARMGADRAFT_1059577 [Armillaria gallica]
MQSGGLDSTGAWIYSISNNYTCRAFLHHMISYHISSLRVAQQHHKYTRIRLTCQYPQATPSAAANASTKSRLCNFCPSDTQVTLSRCSSEISLTALHLVDSSLEESPERLRLLKFRNLDAVSPMKLEALMKPANQDGIEWFQMVQ